MSFSLAKSALALTLSLTAFSLAQTLGLNGVDLSTVEKDSIKAVVTPRNTYLEQLLGDSGSSVSTPAPLVSGKVSMVGQEKKYLIGPGDLLTAMIWTTRPERLPILIESNGRCMIPGVGSVLVNNKSLAQVQEIVKSNLLKKYRNVSIDVFLETPKMVTVAIAGAVNRPGEYSVSGTLRIADIVRLAGGVREEANPRGVRVSNVNLADTTIDLFENLRVQGAETPFIRSGDRIIVPASTEKISVTGAVAYPAAYDFKMGETLSELFSIAGGFSRGVDSSRILVTRFIDERDSVVRFEVTSSQAKSFVLYPDDYIFVPQKKDYRLTREVTINGEVMFPGKYVVRDDKTRLIDLIGLAGGLTAEAYLPGSIVNRIDFSDVGLAEYDRLKVMNQSDLSPDEKSYLKYRKGTKTGRVSLDFEELLKNDQSVNNIIVRGGDEIFVAKRGLSVNVMGAVIKPGLVDYREGESLEYYISRVGGYQKAAERRRVKIIKGGTETWLRPRQVDKIEVGDALWIPERPYVDRVQSIKEFFAITGGIASIVLATITVLNYINPK